MTLPFSQRPGRHERHLLRKRDNPLFPEEERCISGAVLEEAQRLDHEELVAFITEFRGLIYQAVNLKANEDSEVILGIKEELDRSYEQACGLADDQTETKIAIRKLAQLIMGAVRKGAGDDPLALMELEQEEEARAAHFELVEHPIVADLLNPESSITEGELLPALLSESAQGLQAALELFDDTQLALLCEEGRGLLDRIEAQGDNLKEPRQRLREIETRLTADASGPAN
jgi:hypothetical protein